MHRKKTILNNFSRAFSCTTQSVRPTTEEELRRFMLNNKAEPLAAKGNGLSYNDSFFNKNLVLDLSLLNHLISFDNVTGIVVCQGNVILKDLFLLDSEWMPAVIPGTLRATVAGCVAHDVHGKNNHQEGSFGHHICWLELLIQGEKIFCSPEVKPDLFYATIGGLGLTGVIVRVALRLKKSLTGVRVKHASYTELPALLEQMQKNCATYHYQVAWLDLLQSEFTALLSTADPAAKPPQLNKKIPNIPQLPFSLIKAWNIKLFNRFYVKNKPLEEHLSFEQFNNPLDSISQWNRLYGPKGLIQFQGVFSQKEALCLIQQLIKIIKVHKVKPILTVLKLFTNSGLGLLSFCQPGFTIAIDFIHNETSKNAVIALNQLMNQTHNRVYLAKDFLLNAEQYQNMYPKQQEFSQVLKHYPNAMNSELALRLGIKS